MEFEVEEYHLEDLGFVRVPPRIWSTWASSSLPINVLEKISKNLKEFANEKPKSMYFALKSNGKEIEVYSYFELVKKYLNEKAEENRVNNEVLPYLKLGLKKRTETKAGLKVGIVWREGRKSQEESSLTSSPP